MIKPNHLPMRKNYAAMAWHHELVGDPHGGPASGSYEKSGGLGKILGVVAAVAAVSTGWGMLAQGGLQALAGGAMVAGGVMQGIGTITGNAKLAKLGGTLTLAGGLTSMAGDFAAQNGLSGEFVNGSQTLGGSMQAGLESSMNKVGGYFKDVLGGTQAPAEVMDAAKINIEQPSVGAQAGAAGGDAAHPFAQQFAQSAKPTIGVNDPYSGGVIDVGSSASETSASQTAVTGAKPPAATTQAGSGKDQSGLIGWMNKNPAATMMAGQAISGAAGGIGQYEAAKEQARQFDEAMAKNDAEQARRIANMNNGVLFLDPGDSNYAQRKAYAQQNGIKTIDFGIKAGSGPVTTSSGVTASTPVQSVVKY